MNVLANNEKTSFEVTMIDGRYRTWFVTYAREARGMFPKVAKIERMQDNGKYVFRTLYRASCHGDLPTIIKLQMKEASELVRMQ